jgi:hypothetical protein
MYDYAKSEWLGNASTDDFSVYALMCPRCDYLFNSIRVVKGSKAERRSYGCPWCEIVCDTPELTFKEKE